MPPIPEAYVEAGAEVIFLSNTRHRSGRRRSLLPRLGCLPETRTCPSLSYLFRSGNLLLYLVGGIGYLMRRYDFPAAPVIIGMILGPLAEQNFRQAMTISAVDWAVFFTRPLSAIILALAALALFGPKLYQLAVRPKPDHVPGDA